MSQSNTVIIRNLHFSDLPRLSDFFLKSYGSGTVFQNTDFLRWYFFGALDSATPEAAGSIICLVANQIVSFYGGLSSELLVGGKKVTISWGVNAFVLPDFRGHTLNSRSLEKAKAQSQVHGVIGFTKKAADFYKSKGYNLFNEKRSDRYVKVISEANTKAVISFLEPDRLKKFQLLSSNKAENYEAKTDSVITITKENIQSLQTDFQVQIKLTTYRDKTFLRNRFLQHPYINYQVFASVTSDKLSAYCACRDEILQPLGITVTRVIDMFGQPEEIPGVLNIIVARAQKLAHAYVDFSAFGNLYEPQLKMSGFVKLSEDHYTILPQVSVPVEQRPNMEFVGLYSNLPEIDTRNLSHENVYFTRADSDRDRIARINQL